MYRVICKKSGNIAFVSKIYDMIHGAYLSMEKMISNFDETEIHKIYLSPDEIEISNIEKKYNFFIVSESDTVVSLIESYTDISISEAKSLFNSFEPSLHREITKVIVSSILFI